MPKKKAPPRVDKKAGPIREPNPETASSTSPIVERRVIRGIVYQLEMVRCGTATCRCMRGGPGHGPYWYAYKPARKGGGKATAAGRWVSVYIGAEFRELD